MPAVIAATLVENCPHAKLAIFSTSWQYADSQEYRPFNLYAATKQASENILEHYSLRGLKILSLLLFDTYGNDDKRMKLYNILKTAAKLQEGIDVTEGEQEIELINIDDICEGVKLALDELESWDPKWGILKRGLGSGKPVIVKDLIAKLEVELCLPIRANFGAREYREREVMVVTRNYTKPLGWVPKFSDYSSNQ